MPIVKTDEFVVAENIHEAELFDRYFLTNPDFRLLGYFLIIHLHK